MVDGMPWEKLWRKRVGLRNCGSGSNRGRINSTLGQVGNITSCLCVYQMRANSLRTNVRGRQFTNLWLSKFIISLSWIICLEEVRTPQHTGFLDIYSIISPASPPPNYTKLACPGFDFIYCMLCKMQYGYCAICIVHAQYACNRGRNNSTLGQVGNIRCLCVYQMRANS
jgi:hypothetical protein